ncbi:MAG: porin [Rhodobacteraceae bacterium]|nr:MAG: porin [Paracoccaceae bacterium]
MPRTAFTSAGRGGGILFDAEYARSEVPAGVADDRGGNTGFTNKITYLTPRVAGFRAGISYAPGTSSTASTEDVAVIDPDTGAVVPGSITTGSTAGSNTSGTNLNAQRPGEGIEFGLNYSGDFSGFAVQVGGGYTTFLNDGPNDNGWNIGGQVGFQGFAVGVTYGYTERNNADNVAILAVGATYRTGPWAFGLNYGWNVKGDGGDGTTSTRSREDDYGISFGVDYALAPGVLVGGALEYSKADNDVTTASGRDDSAFAAGVFLGLNF